MVERERWRGGLKVHIIAGMEGRDGEEARGRGGKEGRAAADIGIKRREFSLAWYVFIVRFQGFLEARSILT